MDAVRGLCCHCDTHRLFRNWILGGSAVQTWGIFLLEKVRHDIVPPKITVQFCLFFIFRIQCATSRNSSSAKLPMQHSSCPTFMKEIHDEISPILMKETMMYCTEIVILCDCKNIAADVNPWMMETDVFVFFHTSMCFERTKAPLSEGQVELVCPKADPPLERHAHACGHACLCSIPP